MDRCTYVPGVGTVPSGPRYTMLASQTIKIEDQEIRVDSIPKALKQKAVESRRFQDHYAGTSRAPPIIPDEWTARFATELQRNNDAAYRYNQHPNQRREYDREERRSTTRSRASDSGSARPLFTRCDNLDGEPMPPPRDLVESSEFDGRGLLQTSAQSITSTGDATSCYTQELEATDLSECTCPISYHCRHRGHNKLDCRPLVRDMPEFSERRDQTAFDRLRIQQFGGEREVTTSLLVSVVSHLSKFETSSSYREQNSAKRKIENWVLAMEDATIPLGERQHAGTTQALPVLKTFLDASMEQIRRSRRFPVYLVEELTILFRKWSEGDFDGNIKRGLIVKETYDVNNIPKTRQYMVDRTWEFFKDARDFGERHLVNGQMWESRVEMIRDGAHAATMAGIAGTVEQGAWSVVVGEFKQKRDKLTGEIVKEEGYANRDMGDVVEYLGTALPDRNLGSTNTKDTATHTVQSFSAPSRSDHNDSDSESDIEDPASTPEPTRCTRTLMRSLETRRPIRLIRSWRMHEQALNRPAKKGYRYDGLYTVESKTALKKDRQIWSFRLERVPGQGPLRGFGPFDPMPSSNGRQTGHFALGRGAVRISS